MSGLKFAVGALVAVMSATVFTSAADATFWHRRCGYDPYGYHAPDFSGCPRHVRRAYREGWGFYPAYGFYPAGSYYALLSPRYPVYPAYPAAYCYYDNGYDFRVRSVCVPAW